MFGDRSSAIAEWPPHVVGDRANVSEDVLDEHYDRRTQREKMEQRQKYLENICRIWRRFSSFPVW